VLLHRGLIMFNRWIAGADTSNTDSEVWGLFSDRKLFDITNGYGRGKIGHVLIHSFGPKGDMIACGFVYMQGDKAAWDAVFTMQWQAGRWTFIIQPTGPAFNSSFPMPQDKWFSDAQAANCVRWILVRGASAPLVAEKDAPELVGWPKNGIMPPSAKNQSLLELIYQIQNAPLLLLFGSLLVYLGFRAPSTPALWANLAVVIGSFVCGVVVRIVFSYAKKHLFIR
jgi:hypothetical protein